MPTFNQFDLIKSNVHNKALELGMCVCAKSLQWCLILRDPVDVVPQFPLSMRFSRREYWSEEFRIVESQIKEYQAGKMIFTINFIVTFKKPFENFFYLYNLFISSKLLSLPFGQSSMGRVHLCSM